MASRKTCSRCGQRRILIEWTVSPCAVRPKEIKGQLCDRCDIELNAYILSFFRVRNRRKLMDEYRRQI